MKKFIQIAAMLLCLGTAGIAIHDGATLTRNDDEITPTELYAASATFGYMARGMRKKDGEDEE